MLRLITSEPMTFNKPLALPETLRQVDIVSESVFVGVLQSVFTVISRILMPLFWAKIRVVTPAPRLAPGPGTLLLANHKSYYDPLVVGNALPFWSSFRPIRFFSKDELFLKPLSRLFFSLGGAFPAYYGAGLDRSLRIPKRLLEAGQTVLIFPEGRCVRDESLGEGRIGAATLALMTENVRIVPMAIRGAYKIRWGFLKLPEVRVAFGKSYTLDELVGPGGRATPEELTVLLMSKIEELYNQI